MKLKEVLFEEMEATAASLEKRSLVCLLDDAVCALLLEGLFCFVCLFFLDRVSPYSLG